MDNFDFWASESTQPWSTRPTQDELRQEEERQKRENIRHRLSQVEQPTIGMPAPEPTVSEKKLMRKMELQDIKDENERKRYEFFKPMREGLTNAVESALDVTDPEAWSTRFGASDDVQDVIGLSSLAIGALNPSNFGKKLFKKLGKKGDNASSSVSKMTEEDALQILHERERAALGGIRPYVPKHIREEKAMIQLQNKVDDLYGPDSDIELEPFKRKAKPDSKEFRQRATQLENYMDDVYGETPDVPLTPYTKPKKKETFGSVDIGDPKYSKEFYRRAAEVESNIDEAVPLREFILKNKKHK